MSETSEVTTPGLKALRFLSQTWAMRVNSGGVKVRGGFMHLAPEGTPDIMGTRKGRAFACETKICSDEKLRDAQERVAAQLRAAGCFVYRANTAEEVVALLIKEIP